MKILNFGVMRKLGAVILLSISKTGRITSHFVLEAAVKVP